jgi:hypothetical protein
MAAKKPVKAVAKSASKKSATAKPPRKRPFRLKDVLHPTTLIGNVRGTLWFRKTENGTLYACFRADPNADQMIAGLTAGQILVEIKDQPTNVVLRSKISVA